MKIILREKIYSFLFFSTGIKTTIIYPATQQNIAKYSDEQELHIVQESAEDYKKSTLPFIKKKAHSIQVIYILLLCDSKFKYCTETLCVYAGKLDECTSTVGLQKKNYT